MRPQHTRKDWLWNCMSKKYQDVLTIRRLLNTNLNISGVHGRRKWRGLGRLRWRARELYFTATIEDRDGAMIVRVHHRNICLIISTNKFHCILSWRSVIASPADRPLNCLLIYCWILKLEPIKLNGSKFHYDIHEQWWQIIVDINCELRIVFNIVLIFHISHENSHKIDHL